MKQTPLILSVISLIAVVALGIFTLVGNSGDNKAGKAGDQTEATAAQGSIVWFDLDRVLNEYDMANDLRSVVETKIQSIQEEINRRGTKLQNDVNKFQSELDKGVLIRSVAEQRNQKLQQQQNDFNNFANQKQQEIAEEQTVMMNQIGDAINTFLETFSAEHKYAMVLSTQGSVLPAPVAAGDPDLDVTDAIISGLNDEYVKNKAKGTAASSETSK